MAQADSGSNDRARHTRERLMAILVDILVVVVVAAIAVIALPRLRPRATARQVRQKLFDEVQPIALKNCTLERIGSVHDGGYLMCGNLLGDIRSAYSYGIAGDDNWGCQISRRSGVTVHEYDCFDPTRPVCPGGQLLFHDECVGGRRETLESRSYDSVPDQIQKNGDSGKTILMKMDVEGAEIDSLMATPDRLLKKIDQLAIEFHGANQRYLNLVRKLKRTFYVAHLHYNNSRCSTEWKPFPTSAYELLFVNKRIGIPDRSAARPTLPNPLDAYNDKYHGDCQQPIPIEP